MWGSLLKRYWQVIILKETPANTPHSFFLLGLVTLIYLTILVTQWTIADVKGTYSLTNSIFTGMSLLLSFGVYTKIILYLYKKGNRFAQTVTSLLMVNLIIHCLAFPLLFMTSYLLQADFKQTNMLLFTFIYIICTLILSIWQFIAITHVYRCALELSFFPAMLVSVGLLATNILTVSIWR
ncbi:Uncharacterised protein [Legionella busanensis]|uniref:Yip1 domain n=1 Tax=Legionella busanensis TaxID=190655 RepID=A0A378JL42_9GAMM|nr:hypothetical protein [Legionella busanensis]STX51914.1 Uncharacterised protein [Legionella busanensis]